MARRKWTETIHFVLGVCGSAWLFAVVGCLVPFEEHDYWSANTRHPVEIIDPTHDLGQSYIVQLYLFHTGLMKGDWVVESHPEIVDEVVLTEPGWTILEVEGRWDAYQVRLPLTFAAWRNTDGFLDSPSFSGSDVDPCAAEIFHELPTYGTPIRLEVSNEGCCHDPDWIVAPGWDCQH